MVLDANNKITRVAQDILAGLGVDPAMFEKVDGVLKIKAIATNLLVTALALITGGLVIGGRSTTMAFNPSTGVITITTPNGTVTIGNGTIYTTGVINTQGAAVHGGVGTFAEIHTGTPIGVDHGGTGADTAAQALTNLGAAYSGHSHSGAVIVGGSPSVIVPVAQGGTGCNNAPAALDALGGAYAGHSHSGMLVIGGNGIVPISQGGTGTTNAAAALTSLGAAYAGHSHSGTATTAYVDTKVAAVTGKSVVVTGIGDLIGKTVLIA